jgi:hypothetical protein
VASGEPQADAPQLLDPPGAGTKGGVPFTVYFPVEEGYVAADLAHPAPLPRVGDALEYIDEAGVSHRYRVREVLHTLQAVPAARPHVGDSGTSPASLPFPRGGPQAVPESGEVRSGLPKVFLETLPAE